MDKSSTLIVKRVIKADPETLWEALTDQQIMQKWFFAEEGMSATVENNPEAGGNFKIDMHGPDDTFSHKGIYKEMVPHEKMVFTWNSRFVSDTLVTITLNKVKDGTEVKLVHEFMPNEEMKQNHNRGWTQILENLGNVMADLEHG